MDAGGFANSILQGALQGAVLEVRSAVAPPFTVDLSQLASGAPPAPWMEVVKPSLTLSRDGLVILHTAPAGEPGDTDWQMALGLAVALTVGLLLVVALASRS